MEIPKLQIGTITADVPIVQGGMGVKVSLSSLAAAVANEGGIGTIASVGIGDIRTTREDYEAVSGEAIAEEIRKAKSATNGHIAVNVMSVLSNAETLIRSCVKEGIKMIVVGAGLPLKLPAMVEDTTVNLVPIVSSGRAATLILRTWQKRYGRTAQAVVLEGPLAGGHLGFSEEELAHAEDFSLERLVPEVIEALKPFEDAFGVKIPVIAAGGIYTGADIARMLSLGAAGVQMATRFVCTKECGVSDAFKQAYLDATEDDIVIIKSPVGIPGRAIRNRFLERLDSGEPIPINCPYKCLSTCKIYDSRYCIAYALLNAYDGDMEGGLVFAGQNVSRVHEILTVKELMASLLDELRDA
ncbi:MAG TPA: nitronate monooxygenase family protein [Candidatus Hydrogenedentes bacterium]|mgnify:FL=1|nr:nitronate monooxygenase family protein [Candidatus Hydrogenedentota bacterium]HQH53167.1 nitronate monooxygenase family protein [Candidatus Hydrogenedentota bacterium]